MTTKAPDFTIANNKYAHVLCGPFGPSDVDTLQPEFTICVASGSQVTYFEGGDKCEVVKGSSHEICGTDENEVDDKGQEDGEINESMWRTCRFVYLSPEKLVDAFNDASVPRIMLLERFVMINHIY